MTMFSVLSADAQTIAYRPTNSKLLYTKLSQRVTGVLPTPSL